MTIAKVEAFIADDGTLHRTEERARVVNLVEDLKTNGSATMWNDQLISLIDALQNKDKRTLLIKLLKKHEFVS